MDNSSQRQNNKKQPPTGKHVFTGDVVLLGSTVEQGPNDIRLDYRRWRSYLFQGKQGLFPPSNFDVILPGNKVLKPFGFLYNSADIVFLL